MKSLNEFKLGNYKSMSGFLSVLGLLGISFALGVINLYFYNTILFYSFVTSIFITMIWDIVAQYPKIMPYHGYLLHHIITMILAVIAIHYVNFLMPLQFALVSYMLLGAILRRTRTITIFLFPHNPLLHKLNNSLMIFFDFFDLLALFIFGNFIFAWPLLVQFAFFTLVITRLYINGKLLFKVILSSWRNKKNMCSISTTV